MSDVVSSVREAAEGLGFLDASGELVRLDSLMIVDLVIAIEESTGIEVALEELDVSAFRSVAELARIVELHAKRLSGEAEPSGSPATSVVPPPLDTSPPRKPEHANLPASFVQRQRWVMEQVDTAETSANNLRQRIRLTGFLDPEALRRALEDLAARHESFRTMFENVDGIPVLRIAPGSNVALELADLASYGDAENEAAEIATRFEHRPFDLATGPLFRALLVRVRDGVHQLSVVAHHTVWDGHSWGIFWRELRVLYPARLEARTPALAAVQLQPSDHARMESEQTRENGEQMLAAWTETLAGAKPLSLIADHPRSDRFSTAGDKHRFVIDAPLTRGILAFCRREHVTPFVVLTTAFATLLAHWTEQDDVVLGTPLDLRGPELDGTIGMFVNPLPLRVRISGQPTVRELVAHVRRVLQHALAHQNVPLTQHAARTLSGGKGRPLYPAVIVYEPLDDSRTFTIGELTATRVPTKTRSVASELLLYVSPVEHEMIAWLEYATGLFEAGTIARMADQLLLLLAGIIDPRSTDVSIRSLPAESHGLRYWTDHLRGAPAELALPVIAPRGSHPPVGHHQATTWLAGASTGGEMFALLLAALRALLARYCGESDIVIGTPIGALRNQVQGDESFGSLLAREQAIVRAAHDHPGVPVAAIVAALELRRAPFQVWFEHQNPSPRRDASELDLAVSSSEVDGRICIEWHYNPLLLDATAIARMANHYRELVDQVSRTPDVTIRDLALTTTRAPTRVVPAQAPATLWSRFVDVAERDATRPAISDPDRTWSYGELAERASAIASRLDELEGAGPVASLFGHSGEMIAGILGVLAAGRAYVPLDPEHPHERRAYQVRDSGTRAIVCDRAGAVLAAELGAPIFCIDDITAGRHRPRRAPDPDSLAYCLYTSGSTGRPKGVRQTHAHVLHFIDAYRRKLGIESGDVLTLLSTFVFDAAVVDVFSALLSGATVCPHDLRTVGLDGFASYLADRRITIYHSTPTVFRELANVLGPRDVPSRVRAVVLGGEAVLADDAQQFRTLFPTSAMLVNGYGMTECSWALFESVEPGEAPARPAIPIGTPIDGVEVSLETALGPQVACYGVGEIQLASPYLALDAPSPYRTGDLGRWLPDGRLEFAGRAGSQVKIRGFRVDLLEIEHALGELPGVREAAVVVQDSPRGSELVGYVVAATFDAELARIQLGAQLPSYMVPIAIVPLDALPRTPTGKLDRNALPAHQRDAPAGDEHVAPRTEIEKQLAAVWSRLLGVERVGAHDNFFGLGGHSLLAIRLVSELERTFGVRVPVREIFESPTLEAIAKFLATAIPGDATPEIAYPPTAATTARATSAQEYFWQLDRDDHDPASYCWVKAAIIDGPLDAERFSQSYREVAAYHSVYRTAYRQHGGVLEQLVRPLGEVTPDELELVTGAPIPEGQWRAELERAAAALVARDYDLDTGAGLLRACLLRLSPDRHAFVQAAHHIVMDGGGATAFHRQVFEGYGLLRDGPSALSEPPLQYIDYSHARERWLGSPAGKKNEEFWRDYVRGARPVILEGDFPRASIDARRDASPRGVTADLSYPPEVMSLPNEIYASVAAAARTARTTPYVIFMAALAWLLRERSGQHDLAIQSTYNSRVEDPALAQVNGCITTWTLTRIDLDGAMRFADAIARTRVAVGIVQDHAAPGDYYGIVPHGLRRVVFNYMPVGPAVGHAAASDVPASEIRVKPYPWGFPIWKRTWDLHLTVSDNGSSPQLFWTGFSQLFRRESVRALLARYVELLARAV